MFGRFKFGTKIVYLFLIFSFHPTHLRSPQIQGISSPESLEAHEKISRYLVISLHFLRETQSLSKFYGNVLEQIEKGFITLQSLYEFHPLSPNRAEFWSYYLLFSLGGKGDKEMGLSVLVRWLGGGGGERGGGGGRGVCEDCIEIGPGLFVRGKLRRVYEGGEVERSDFCYGLCACFEISNDSLSGLLPFRLFCCVSGGVGVKELTPFKIFD